MTRAGLDAQPHACIDIFEVVQNGKKRFARKGFTDGL
jgi:hypothetical protein